jgi:hypothetical protein
MQEETEGRVGAEPRAPVDTEPMKDHAFAEAARKLLNASNNDDALRNLGRLLPDLPTIGSRHGPPDVGGGVKVNPAELPE